MNAKNEKRPEEKRFREAKQFQKIALRLAIHDAETAIVWIKKRETTWAITMLRSALQKVEAARES